MPQSAPANPDDPATRRRSRAVPKPMRNAQHEAIIDQFAAGYTFPLDEFQREAIRVLLEGDSVLVAAPTGTGKTVVAEFGIWDAMRRTGRVLYTTPIKALSNQKYRDLRAIYGDEVGLLTGDVSENRDARIVVMTTEVLRNMLLQSPWDVDAVDCVIFDEIHYLADPERGTTWEESIILCPDHVQLICLSATVSNAGEIADWISRGHRPTRLITHLERAVPLTLSYFHDDKLHLSVNHQGELVKDFPHTGGELKRQANKRGGFGRHRSERPQPEMDEPQPREIIDALAAGDLLPAIYFLFSRNDCQAFAERLAVMRPHLITPRQSALIEQTISAVLTNLRPEDRELAQVQTICQLARKGLGFHHAGLLPVLKQLVEVLFSRGLMEVVFATDTLALGVNMPARTVIIGRMSKWDGRRRRMLIPNEFQQMAGRAGRRGMDRFGHVVIPYTPWFTFRETLDIATGELHPVRSAFAIRYNTVLNLWDPPAGERVRAMLQESLAQFQSSQRMREIEDEILRLGEEISAIPQGCLIGLDAGDELLEDYRGLNRSLTAAQNKERRLESDQAMIDRSLATATPWTEPGRQALRRLFRDALPGLVVHLRDGEWAVFLGRGSQGGVGRFLLQDGRIELIAEYRQLDQVADRQVELPFALVEPASSIDSALVLVDDVTLQTVLAQLAALALPDLTASAAAFRETQRQRIDDTILEMDSELAEARVQAKTLQQERAAHPCHTCDRRKEHRDLLAQADKLDQVRQGFEAQLSRESEAEDDRIRGVIRGIRNVLHRFGYLHRGYPTPKADMLAAVFDTDGLILCELVDRGTLNQLEPADLAEVFSWYSFDRDFRNSNRFVLPDRLVLARRRIEDVEHIVLGEERAEGFDVSEGHNPNFYGAARAWCRGQTMAEISAAIDLSEGDLVLTFNKTIDLMRQIREMLYEVQPTHPLVQGLTEATRQMKRDIVEQSLLLGFLPISLPEPEADLLVADPPAAPPLPRPRTRRNRKITTEEDSATGAPAADQTAGVPASLVATPGDVADARSFPSAKTDLAAAVTTAPATSPGRIPRKSRAARTTSADESDAPQRAPEEVTLLAEDVDAGGANVLPFGAKSASVASEPHPAPPAPKRRSRAKASPASGSAEESPSAPAKRRAHRTPAADGA